MQRGDRMLRKIFAITIILGILMGFSAGVGSAYYNTEDEPPRPGDEPPRPGDCDLDDWEVMVAERLAARYDVTYDDIVGWYCEGYDFPEIAFAYEIALRTEYTPGEIFAMLDGGMTWYDILQAVGLLDRYPPRWRRIPFVVPPVDIGNRGMGRPLCTSDDEQPAIQALADLYGITYDQAYQWICGPYDFSNTGWWGADWMPDLSGFTYNDGTRMHITGPVPNIDPDDLPDLNPRSRLKDLLPIIIGDDDLPIGRRRP